MMFAPQVILGTNRCGRIQHDQLKGEDGKQGQMFANDERIEQLLKHFEHVHVEMEPGK